MALLIGTSVAAEPAGAAPGLVGHADARCVAGEDRGPLRSVLPISARVLAGRVSSTRPAPLCRSPSAGPAAHWAIASPPASSATGSFLFGVSCATARSCMAVGSSTRHRERCTGRALERVAGRFSPNSGPVGTPGAHPTAYLAAVRARPRRLHRGRVRGQPRRDAGGAPDRPVDWSRRDGRASRRRHRPRPRRRSSGSVVRVAHRLRRRGLSCHARGDKRNAAEHWTQDSWHLERIPTRWARGGPAHRRVAPVAVVLLGGRVLRHGGDRRRAVRALDGIRWAIGARYPRGARSARLARCRARRVVRARRSACSMLPTV